MIIDYLTNQKEQKSGQEIADALDIPKRTLVRLIKEINSNETIIESSRKGYWIHLNHVKHYQDLQQDQSDRITNIIHLLTFNKEGINFFDLMNQLFISESTLQSDLRKVKSILSKYSLKLEIKNNMIHIIHSEKNERNLIKDYIYGEIYDKKPTVSELENFFPTFNVEIIRKSITDTFFDHHLFIDDFTLFSLMLHIMIKIERNTHQCYLEEKNLTNQQKNEEFYLISSEICSRISSIIHLNFTETEIYELGILLSSNLHKLDKFNQNSEYVSNEVTKLTENIIQYVDEIYGIDLDSKVFVRNLSLHIKNLILRLKNNIFVYNPLKEQLKQMYPFIYEISLDIMNTFLSKYGKISEDENAYVTLHLISQIDMKHTMDNKLHCILLSPDFYSLNKQLFSIIKNKYQEDLYIEDILPSETMIDNYQNDIDLIISTIHWNQSDIKNIIQINLIPTKEDFDKLNYFISQIMQRKTINKLKLNVLKYFKSDLFVSCNEIMDYQEAIKIGSKILYDKNIVSKEFENDCILREELSPTTFKKIAIPHPIQAKINQSCIFVLVNSKYFNWINGSKIKIILILAIEKADMKNIQPLYDFIALYVNNNINHLFQNEIHSYDDFLSLIDQFTQQFYD